MRIGDTDTASLTNSQSQELVKSCGNLLQLYVRKPGTEEPTQQNKVGEPASQGALHELFDDIFKESDAMFSSLEAEQQQQQARAASAASYSPSFAVDDRDATGPCNGYSPCPPQSQTESADTGFPTRLARQLSELSTNSFVSPPPSNPSTPQQQSGPPDFGSYYGSRSVASRRTPVQSPEVMPDAVLNMAAKGGPEKKPWSYAPNTDMLQEQRNRVRRKPASGAVLPRYQNMLGMFDDSPVTNSRPSPVTSPLKTAQEPSYPQGPGDAVVAHVQYNTPIGLYSNDNVMEAFEGQSGGVVTGVDGLPGKPKADITQSAVYKMIHGVDDPPKPRHRIPPPVHSKPAISRDPTGEDEMKFSGLRSDRDIPSKAFTRLQNMTGPSEVDTSSIRQRGADDVDEVSGYDETSIRYRGRNIPSKSFRMLQSMTGSGSDEPAGVRQRGRKTTGTNHGTKRGRRRHRRHR
ncbi:hypothetical protein NP493_504g03021 [Ridgeia piscesae]|uniref:Zasp-like motif domain-containing protein n=1 Tax=Ridgeia piscesae TaxID=27915 RepID=A0AAD9KXH3_RIDPI|nr:hypothetical protein NP493_504g03021 [Ridgeia piscesae]